MTGGEVWSINPVFDPTGEFPGGVNQAALEAAATAIANRTVPVNMRTNLSNMAFRSGARVEVRADADDALIAISTIQSTTPSGGGTGPTMPPQTASVISLRTDAPGGSGRGRLYWPFLQTTLGADGKLTAAQVTSFITDAKAYLLGIRSDLAAAFPTIGFDLSVRSKTTHTTPHVVRIQVGNVLDTQRRRRDNLPETYQTSTFP